MNINVTKLLRYLDTYVVLKEIILLIFLFKYHLPTTKITVVQLLVYKIY